jgi:hypothetical protein
MRAGDGGNDAGEGGWSTVAHAILAGEAARAGAREGAQKLPIRCTPGAACWPQMQKVCPRRKDGVTARLAWLWYDVSRVGGDKAVRNGAPVVEAGERRGRRSRRVDDLPRDEHLPHWHEKDFKVATANHIIRKGLSHMLGDGRLWTTMDEVRRA